MRTLLIVDDEVLLAEGLSLHEQLAARQDGCQVIYLTGYSEFEYARRALDQQAFAYVLKGEGDEKVIETIERALAARERPMDPTDESEAAGDWLESLKTHIQTHLSEDLSLNQLAEQCHFHPVYLSRVFKEATGETLSDYINHVKQQRAEELLRVNDLSVLEISRITGFATDNYFCRWFRKRTGATPQAYRAKCRKRR